MDPVGPVGGCLGVVLGERCLGEGGGGEGVHVDLREEGDVIEGCGAEGDLRHCGGCGEGSRDSGGGGDLMMVVESWSRDSGVSSRCQSVRRCFKGNGCSMMIPGVCR